MNINKMKNSTNQDNNLLVKPIYERVKEMIEEGKPVWTSQEVGDASNAESIFEIRENNDLQGNKYQFRFFGDDVWHDFTSDKSDYTTVEFGISIFK